MQRLRLVLLPGRARQCFCVLMNLTVVANSENNADGFDTKVEGNTTYVCLYRVCVCRSLQASLFSPKQCGLAGSSVH